MQQYGTEYDRKKTEPKGQCFLQCEYNSIGTIIMSGSFREIFEAPSYSIAPANKSILISTNIGLEWFDTKTKFELKHVDTACCFVAHGSICSKQVATSLIPVHNTLAPLTAKFVSACREDAHNPMPRRAVCMDSGMHEGCTT
jgi:hypothetical protein